MHNGCNCEMFKCHYRLFKEIRFYIYFFRNSNQSIKSDWNLLLFSGNISYKQITYDHWKWVLSMQYEYKGGYSAASILNKYTSNFFSSFRNSDATTHFLFQNFVLQIDFKHIAISQFMQWTRLCLNFKVHW